ncbi:hypothetical protein PCANB_000818 [Pneumocystis canis]|nr:hypothetical protein PCANB_000818 [Pneumocystis canis]
MLQSSNVSALILQFNLSNDLSSISSSNIVFNIASFIVQYESIIDQCISSIILNNNSTEIISENLEKTYFLIYILGVPETLPFSTVQHLLNILYTKIQYIKGKYQCFYIEDIIIFAGWCGYSLFNEPYQWKTIYTFQDEVVHVPSSLNKYVYILTKMKENKEKVIEYMKEFSNEMGQKKYKLVIVGGTFDYFHAGHKILLTMTAWICNQQIVCGVSDEALLVTKKYRNLIQPIEIRMGHVRLFFHLINRTLLLFIIPIVDIYGSSIDKNIEAIVVSKETLLGGNMVNEERQRKNINLLDLYCIDMILCPNINGIVSKLSSTDIREKISKI